MWMEIWIHSVGWDTNFISLNPVHLNPLSNADFSLCRLCNIPYQISHSSVLARTSQYIVIVPWILVLRVQPLLCLCSLGTTSTTYIWEWGKNQDKILSADQENFRETLHDAACCCFYGRKDTENSLCRWTLGTC